MTTDLLVTNGRHRDFDLLYVLLKTLYFCESVSLSPCLVRAAQLAVRAVRDGSDNEISSSKPKPQTASRTSGKIHNLLT